MAEMKTHGWFVVQGSGHAPISYKPKQGFAMGQRWLDRKPL